MRFGHTQSSYLASGDAAIQTLGARDLTRGVCRSLGHLGYSCLTEFKLATRRRVDIIGLDRAGLIAIVEIKSSIEDFRADRKWREYLDFCDFFFFAVAQDFPREVVPEECGLLIADAYGAATVRDAPKLRLNPARRRAMILRFARTAGQRLAHFVDPEPISNPSQPPRRRPRAATRLL